MKKQTSKAIRSKRPTQQSLAALDQKGPKKAIRKAEADDWRAKLFSCISFICSEHQEITNLKPICCLSLVGWFCNTEE